MSSSTRETLHLSLGAPACQVTAHLLNLEGLAATCDTANGLSALCDPTVTHATDHQVYVPRVLMVDEPSTFRRSARRRQEQSGTGNADTGDTDLQLPTWTGAIERLDHRAPPPPPSDDADAALQQQYHHRAPPHQHEPQQEDALGSFLETASTLAYGPYSRYRAPHASSSTTAATASYTISSSNDRHVQWDEDEDEEQEDDRYKDDGQDEGQREEQALRQRDQYRQRTQLPLQGQLNDFWSTSTMPSTARNEQPPEAAVETVTTDVTDTTKESSPDQQQQEQQHLTWMDYWMPPYHPRSCLPLPVHQDSELVHHWDSYTTGTGANQVPMVQDWKQDDLLESLRTMLEDCDSCQGVTIASSGHGLYAGLTTVLLQELQEECPSATRWVWSIQDDDNDGADTIKNESTSTWHGNHVQRLRRQVETGLAWHSHVELASSVLPLQLPAAAKSGLSGTAAALAPAAYAAAALESATLPYRLSGQSKQSQMGLNSYYYGSFGGENPFGTAPKLGFGEFLTSLQPSPRHNVLELDSLLPGTLDKSSPLWDRLQEGTSVERDHRMRDRQKRSRDVPPGAWMQSANAGQDGVLTNLSPHMAASKANADRSLHHHFGLSTSVRASVGSSSDATISQYVTCLMQGMGIRYRPESSIATVTNQSLATLTGNGYAAGSYWQSVWGTQTPVLSVLGNSTRVYPHLHQISADIKQAMLPRYRGYYNRDVTDGLLPEAEDCQEALAYCFDVRDLYRPPDGSGLAVDEEGSYFDQS